MNYQKEAILDRARGALVATAVADALGAGYEFQAPLPDSEPVVFKAKLFDLGEYTDDTAMMVAIARAAKRGNLITELDLVAEEFFEWFKSSPKDIGIQTRKVLKNAKGKTAADLTESATEYLDSHERAAGNGSLMRTAAVALPFLSNPESVGIAADQISSLTHMDLDCREACVIWSKAIRHAILFENFDGIQLAINELPAFRQNYWNEIFDQAESASSPTEFANNGWVIHAIQAAYSAIRLTQTEDPSHLVAGIEAAVRVGNDTDTVAAIAGGLLGARWGYSAIPAKWLKPIHGWPGLKTKDLVNLADEITEPIWL
ncbi:MAG: ADP-ribosylglycohydrolase family protein [Micrococcales bacterium]|nr:ADP-ribosylglycohydrolase family protein [Micrococcales bacterium]NBR55153.1 ADP-ribosylglycohydrolase family protein [Micrococcales bacterium]NBR61077.1 ADP-ribosylglycohydrolase family protein [Actinomycetota bacterium]NBY43348.1 ADP-ribosylglycohydrolase family protein [Micrococcales bacterium]NDE88702.1 ADP-ribosylglycohydrolase family protein [Micrococcales bacterium]